MAYEEMFEDIKAQIFPQKEKKYKCMQDLIDLPDIMEGMYCLGDGRYVKVAEIIATNFSNKENSEQNAIISTFAGWLKVAPSKVQLKVTTRLSSENKFAKKLESKEADCNNKSKKLLYRSVIDFIRRESRHSAVNVRYFLIFEYEDPRIFGKKEDLPYISAQMDGIIDQAQKYFNQMGNVILKKRDDDIFLGEFIYELVNRESSKTTSFKERAQRVLGDILRIRQNAGIENPKHNTKYVNLISPMGASLKTLPDAFIADKTYFSYYYIPSKGYPMEVPSGWLTSRFAGMVDVDIDIFFRKVDKREFIKRVRQSSKFTSLKAQTRTTNSKDASEIGSAMASQDYIREAMNNPNNPQEPFYVATIFTVAASNYEELVEKCNTLEEMALTSNITLSKMTHYEWLGFKATLPFNDVPNKIWFKARRNILTDGLAGFYPFTAFELDDEDGIVIGLNSENRTLVTIDPYNKDKYANANMLILGGSGKGKTFLMSLLASRTVLLDKQVFIITSEKGHEFKRLCDFLGGTFVKFSSANKSNINPFEIRPESSIIKEIYGEDIEDSLRMKKSKSISGWMQLLFKSLREEEIIALDRAVINMYDSFGITDDNNSIYVDDGEMRDENGNPILKEMPIMSDLLAALLRVKEEGGAVSNKLLAVVENFINGTYSSFNQQTNVDLNNSLVVFDMTSLANTIEDATIHLCLDYIWSRVKEDPTIQKTIIVEEGWKYISEGSSDDSAKLVQEIFKIIRGFGGNAIFATQQLEDITASEYGKSVIDCSTIKILLGVEEGRSGTLIRGLNIRPDEGRALEGYNKGAAILIAGKDHVPVQIKASELEEMIFSTKAEDIASYNERMKRILEQI